MDRHLALTLNNANIIRMGDLMIIRGKDGPVKGRTSYTEISTWISTHYGME